MQCLQSTGRQIYRYISRHVQILVENKLDLLILLTVALDYARSGVHLYTTTAANGDIGINTASGEAAFFKLFV